MSMEGADGGADTEMAAPAPDAEAAPADMYSDPSFLSDVISELEGVDPNDPEVKAMMEGLNEEKKDDK
jgi:hypothetical protein